MSLNQPAELVVAISLISQVVVVHVGLCRKL